METWPMLWMPTTSWPSFFRAGITPATCMAEEPMSVPRRPAPRSRWTLVIRIFLGATGDNQVTAKGAHCSTDEYSPESCILTGPRQAGLMGAGSPEGTPTMLLKIEGLLNTTEVAKLRTQLAHVKFDDGKATAGVAVRDVKNNLQTVPVDKALDEPRITVLAAILKNELFNQYVLPRRVLPLMFNRYDSGMDYGGHVDNAIMGGGDPMRADLSITVFLTDPADYGGGE